MELQTMSQAKPTLLEVPNGPRLHRPAESESHTARWRINGYGATITVWTDAEWQGLSDRPADAQYLSCGVWCRLRMDE